ncbi:MAG: hypothetical protein JWP42_4348 [Pseudomonas sp.]|nr:hypothetical protein [Pseudomonas sp.]
MLDERGRPRIYLTVPMTGLLGLVQMLEAA